MINIANRRVGFLAASVLTTAAAHADPFIVDALANSSSGGIGVATISLLAGESFNVSVASTDLWSAGALPRWSNANGLTATLLATGADESGQVAGTQIGADFGLHAQGNLSAPFGTLVGQIGGGDYFAIGTSFSGVAASAGTLNLYYWDSNSADNVGSVTANVTAAIPEPASYVLLLAGLGALALAARRRAA
jgi:hypothetical protein